MKKIALALIFLLSPFLLGWKVYWTSVCCYTDNTAIEPTKTIMYNIYLDNVLTCSKVLDNSCFLPISDFGVQHVIVGNTELSTGEKSADTPPYYWTSPQASEVNTPSAGTWNNVILRY